MKSSHDIVIVGGGIAGYCCALMLAELTSLSIAVLEASPLKAKHRVSAIALSSKKIFQSLGFWRGIADETISPFREILVWDAGAKGEIVFNGKEIGEALLGYIIENHVIQNALEKKLNEHAQVEIIVPVKLTQLIEHEQAVELVAEDGRRFSGRLAIAADGANSWLRTQAGIEAKKFDYHQHAITATVKTTLPHHEIARQVFLPTGPLAFLPLSDPHTSSIVWSLHNEEAQRVMYLAEQDFLHELSNAFEYRLGDVISAGERYTFPLSRQKTTKYIKNRIVLIGDAAHTIHPLAGQGLNMSLLDAASLADVISDAINHNRDFSSNIVLRRYERWRKADNLLMFAGVDIIKHLFENDKKSVQTIRSLGLNAVNRIKFLKNIFTLHAVGSIDGLPKLARGQM